MKSFPYLFLLGCSLAGCGQQTTSPTPEAAASAATATSLVGTWQLTRLESSVPATGAVPNQRLTLDSTRHFQFYDGGKLLSAGTYSLGTGSACSAAASPEALLKVSLTTPNAYAPHGNYTLTGNTLVIDGCLAADGPRYTFQRQP